MLGNFCRRLTHLKQRVNKKLNFKIDSPASSGVPVKYMNYVSLHGLR